jgi:hypothetical protein
MKQFIIAALVCLNAALLLALVFGAGTQKAYGQVIGANYLLMTGHVNEDNDAVYVLDLASRRLAAWRWDKTAKRLAPIAAGGGRELLQDFNRVTNRPRR